MLTACGLVTRLYGDPIVCPMAGQGILDERVIGSPTAKDGPNSWIAQQRAPRRQRGGAFTIVRSITSLHGGMFPPTPDRALNNAGWSADRPGAVPVAGRRRPGGIPM